MSGPTPIVPNGEVRLDYTVASLVHQVRMRCSINNPAGPSPYLLDLFGGGTINWATAVHQFDALVSAFYHSDVAFGSWTLYQRVGTNYVPLDGASSTAAGTNTGDNQAAGQMTLTAKNAANLLDKFVFLESSFLPPQKVTSYPYGGAGTFMDDWINTASGHLGSWVLGRNGQPATRLLANVVTLNRKIRRRRGLV